LLGTIQTLAQRACVRTLEGRTPRVHDLRHNSESRIIPSGGLEGAEFLGFRV
jgi:hypothetical protein